MWKLQNSCYLFKWESAQLPSKVSCSRWVSCFLRRTPVLYFVRHVSNKENFRTGVTRLFELTASYILPGFWKYFPIVSVSLWRVPLFISNIIVWVQNERLSNKDNRRETLWSGSVWGKFHVFLRFFSLALLVQILMAFHWRCYWQNDRGHWTVFFFSWQCKSSPDTLILVVFTVAQQEAELVKDLSSSLSTASPRGLQISSSFSEVPMQKSSVMSPADQFASVARTSMRMQKLKQKLDSVMVSLFFLMQEYAFFSKFIFLTYVAKHMCTVLRSLQKWIHISVMLLHLWLTL